MRRPLTSGTPPRWSTALVVAWAILIVWLVDRGLDDLLGAGMSTDVEVAIILTLSIGAANAHFNWTERSRAAERDHRETAREELLVEQEAGRDR